MGDYDSIRYHVNRLSCHFYRFSWLKIVEKDTREILLLLLLYISLNLFGDEGKYGNKKCLLKNLLSLF